jgi:hypothetical protein
VGMMMNYGNGWLLADDHSNFASIFTYLGNVLYEFGAKLAIVSFSGFAIKYFILVFSIIFRKED